MADFMVFCEEINGVYIERIRRMGAFEMDQKHFHSAYEIYYLYEGERYYFIENQSHQVKAGSMVFIDSNQIHKTGGSCPADHDRILFNISRAGLLQLQKQVPGFSLAEFFEGYSGMIQFFGDNREYVERLLLELQNEVMGKKVGYADMALLKLAQLFVYARRCLLDDPAAFQPKGKKNSKFEKVHEISSYLSEHYQRQISLEELSERFFISKYYLCRMYREITGLTLKEYVNLVRVQKAQQLLEETSLSVTEVAERAGFDSITYFERIFKKYMSQTPLRYRKVQNSHKHKLGGS